jgi:hypothetical protein
MATLCVKYERNKNTILLWFDKSTKQAAKLDAPFRGLLRVILLMLHCTLRLITDSLEFGLERHTMFRTMNALLILENDLK